MNTTADKLNHLIDTKESIRQELNRAYGTEEVTTSDTFNSYIQKLEEHPFYLTTYLDRTIRSIRLSNVTSIGNSAFYGCEKLTDASFPNVTSINVYAFKYCGRLTNTSFPNVTSIGSDAFGSCHGFTDISFPKVTSINTHAFSGCYGLVTIYVGTETSTVCTLLGTNAFSYTPSLTNIYVPASLVDSYKSATNWSEYADKIKAAP